MRKVGELSAPHILYVAGHLLKWFMEHKFEFDFNKVDEMVYISHLDLLRLLSRGARRAGLPVALTCGFNRHFKIRLSRALKLGIASCDEKGEIFLNSNIDREDLKNRWQNEMPAGIKFKEVRLR